MCHKEKKSNNDSGDRGEGAIIFLAVAFDSVLQQSEAGLPCTQCPKWDKEKNRSRFPLQLVCCRASEELTFYLSVAIGALEAVCLGHPNVGTRPVPRLPSYSSGGL